MKISPEVKAAFIFGIFGILYLIIPWTSGSNLQISDATWDGNYLDLKIRNIGNQVAIVKEVSFEIKNAQINYTPDIRYWRWVNRTNNVMEITIANHGWGKAYDLKFRDLVAAEELVSHFAIDPANLSWEGDILPGERVNFQYPLKFKSYDDNQETNHIIYEAPLYSNVTYSDQKGSLHSSITKSPYEFSAYANNKTIYYDYRILLTVVMGTSAVYCTELSPEMEHHFDNIIVSHELQPNTADRLKIGIKTTKSAIYSIVIHIKYNENDEVESKQILVDMIRYNDEPTDARTIKSKDSMNEDVSWTFSHATDKGQIVSETVFPVRSCYEWGKGKSINLISDNVPPTLPGAA